MEYKIVTFGEILLRWSKDHCFRIGQGNQYNGNFGGSEANVAVSLSLLGDSVEYVSRIPRSQIGQACVNALRNYGIDTRHVEWGGERLGTYYFEASAAMRNSKVVYDRNGSSFYSCAPGMFPWREIFKDVQLFHCSGITCSVSKSAADATFEAVRIAKEMGLTICCDINYRKNLWKYGADAHTILHELMQYSDFIFGDQNEWEVATGVPHIHVDNMQADTQLDMDAYRRYFDEMHRQFPNCRSMILALRNQMTTNHHTLTGLLWHEGEIYLPRIYDIYPVLDPMGVGDAYVAAYIHAALKRPYDPQFQIDFALAASQLKNSISGDFNLVTEEEILEQMQEG